MELSYFLAKLFGITLMIFSVVAYFRPTDIAAIIRDIKPFSFPLLLAGFLGIFGGLAIILSHNVWEMNWRVIITLFGWAAVVKGISYVAFPEMIMRTGMTMFEGGRQKVFMIVTFLLGCYLVYHGFSFGV